jgi:hypothetical protein
MQKDALYQITINNINLLIGLLHSCELFDSRDRILAFILRYTIECEKLGPVNNFLYKLCRHTIPIESTAINIHKDFTNDVSALKIIVMKKNIL